MQKYLHVGLYELISFIFSFDLLYNNYLSGMRTMDVRIPQTVIPNKETNYFCMIVDLPRDQDYHLAATTPILNNTDVIHHMLLFGCSESETNYSNLPKNIPYPCGMQPHQDCAQLIGVWTIGTTVDCGSPNAGFRFGKNGFQTAALQVCEAHTVTIYSR